MKSALNNGVRASMNWDSDSICVVPSETFKCTWKSLKILWILYHILSGSFLNWNREQKFWATNVRLIQISTLYTSHGRVYVHKNEFKWRTWHLPDNAPWLQALATKFLEGILNVHHHKNRKVVWNSSTWRPKKRNVRKLTDKE